MTAPGVPEPEPHARSLSEPESPERPLSFWLQLMLAEIAAKREALEQARAEEARRSVERDAAAPAVARRGDDPG